MNKAAIEAVLDNFLSWKAVSPSVLKRIKKEIADENRFKLFLEWYQASPAQALIDARGLATELMWTGYAALQISGLEEQKVFYKARANMVAAFKARYPHGVKHAWESAESRSGRSNSAVGSSEGRS